VAKAIRYLQVLSGAQYSGMIGKVHDISGDGRVGMEEVINIFERQREILPFATSDFFRWSK
jgi:hypothetical protein